MGNRRSGRSANNRIPRNLRFENYDDDDSDGVICLGDSNDMVSQISDTESSEDHGIKCLWEKPSAVLEQEHGIKILWENPSAVLEQDGLQHFCKTFGNNNASMNSKEHKLDEATKRDFRTEKSSFPQNIWFPTEQPVDEGYSMAFLGENAEFLGRKRSSGSVDDIDQIHKSTSISKAGSGSRDVGHDEFGIAKIVGVGFDGKTRAAAKIVTSTRKESSKRHSADTSRKISDDADNIRFSDLQISTPYVEGGSDFAQISIDKSDSQSQKGNSDEDTDPAEPERTDEAEFTG